MKKLLLTAMVTSLLILPFGATALTNRPETSSLLSGHVPATSTRTEAIAPAIHATLLAMEHQDVTSFDASNAALVWEALYNTLSMYGQLDERAEVLRDTLTVPSESVADVSALFGACLSSETLPTALQDRMTYNLDADQYQLVYGNDELADVVFTHCETEDGITSVTGSLIYVVDQSSLADFSASIVDSDTLFGYTISELLLI